ncbi:MAG: peptidase M42 [Phycisphaerales bacterium]
MIPGSTRERVIQKTLEYLDRPAVVGFERPFLEFMEREFARLGCETTLKDTLLECNAPGGRHEIICIHADRHGLIHTSPGVFEYAAWIARDEYASEDRPTSPATAVRVCTRFVDEPVLAYDPVTGAALARAVTRSARYDEEEAKLTFPIPEFRSLPLNIPVCFRRMTVLDHETLSGQLDNAISAAIAFALVERGFGGRVLFTTEEEIGRSWIHAKDHLDDLDIRTDRLIVLDTSPYYVTEAIDRGYVVLRRRDAHAAFNPVFVEELAHACERVGVPYEYKDDYIDRRNAQRELDGDTPLSYGSTELGRLVSATEGEITGATIQIPTYGYHSNSESTSTLAIDHVIRLLAEVLKLDLP